MEQKKKDSFSFPVRKGFLRFRVIVNEKSETIYARLESVNWQKADDGMMDSLIALNHKKTSFLGSAKCHPTDKFSVKAGSSLAMDRLLRQCRGYVGTEVDKSATKAKNYFSALINGVQDNIPPRPEKDAEEGGSDESSDEKTE